MLYDLNSSENLQFPFWKDHGRLDHDSVTDDECNAEVRFYENQWRI